MAKTINQFKLGLFILFCGSLGLVVIIWLGASHYFEKKKVFVSYFAESVKGLQKDAVDNYLGVPVERVGGIGLAPDGRLIEVLLYLKPEFEVDNRLVIRLLEQGLTGLRYLEIVAAPEDTASATPVISFQHEHPLIRCISFGDAPIEDRPGKPLCKGHRGGFTGFGEPMEAKRRVG